MEFDISEEQMTAIIDQLGAGEVLRGLFSRAHTAGMPIPIAELPSLLTYLATGISDFAKDLGASDEEAQSLGEVAICRAERDFWGRT